MPIRVIINGAHGKMGQETVKAIQNDPRFTLIAETGKNDALATLLKKHSPDAAIDFTTPSAVYENCLTIIDAHVRPVIGTTGLTEQQIKHLQQLCAQKKLGGVIAPNFALGAVLMMQFAQIAARFFPQVEIIEQHHPAKRDAPSGTALKTAAMMTESRGNTTKITPYHESLPGARGADCHGIPIHSVRLTGVIAAQEVLFGGPGETLSIRENTLDRKAFMPGLLLACEKVMALQTLVYGLEHILKINEGER